MRAFLVVCYFIFIFYYYFVFIAKPYPLSAIIHIYLCMFFSACACNILSLQFGMRLLRSEVSCCLSVSALVFTDPISSRRKPSLLSTPSSFTTCYFPNASFPSLSALTRTFRLFHSTLLLLRLGISIVTQNNLCLLPKGFLSSLCLRFRLSFLLTVFT